MKKLALFVLTIAISALVLGQTKAPSSSFITFRASGGSWQVAHPNNWKPFSETSVATVFTPKEQMAGSEILVGVFVGFFKAQPSIKSQFKSIIKLSGANNGITLDDALGKVIKSYKKDNPHLSESPGARYKTQIAGQEALATYLTSRAASGVEKQWWLVVRLNGDQAVYLLGVTPKSDFPRYEATFKTMAGSFSIDGGQPVADVAVPSQSNRPNAPTKQEMFQQLVNDGEQTVQICRDFGETNPAKLIDIETIDLNNDGAPEIKVLGKMGCTCGARRCDQWLYKKTSSGYSLLATIASVDEVDVLNSYTNGYRDLELTFGASASGEVIKQIWKFDGTRYREGKQVRQRSAAPSTGPARLSGGPPVPFEDNGACPFECCQYRTWTANKATVIQADRQANSSVAFRVQRGEKVTALTGVVITTQAGEAKLLASMMIGGTRAKAGEIVYLLTYKGEGFYKVWYKGNIGEVSLDDTNHRVIKEPQSVWWVKIKNRRGQIGWSKQAENFDNKDSCS